MWPGKRGIPAVSDMKINIRHAVQLKSFNRGKYLIAKPATF